MRSERGMTLLEVLVALMLLALTGVLLSEGLHFGTRVWERAGAGAEAAVARSDALATLRRLIEQAEPPEPGDDATAFVGDGGRLAFASPEGAWLGGGSRRRIELYRAERGDSVRLRIDAIGGEAGPEDLRLIDGVTGLSLRYYGYDETLAADAWVDRWSGRAELPLLVEVTVELADAGAAPVLRIMPRRQAAVACLVYGGTACQVRRR